MRIKDIPHKNLLASALIALMIFVVGFFSIHPINKAPKGDDSLLAAKTTTTSAKATDTDSDKDGLLDWKEKLYGADMYNPDTDGDGTSDGDEVSIGRDPTIPNTAGTGNPPNDMLKYLQDPNFATSSTDVQGMKKDFFAKYLAESGKNIKETTFRDLISKVDPAKFQAKNELVSLRITSDNSTESIKTYLNAFGLLIDKYTVRTNRTEDEILADAMKTKNKETLKELQLPAIAYQNFSKDLLRLEVPSVLAKAHLMIINGYEGMGKSLLGMQNVFDDPVNGTAGLQAYSKHKLDVTSGYAMIVAYIGKKQIEIGKDEPGAPFYWQSGASASTQK